MGKAVLLPIFPFSLSKRRFLCLLSWGALAPAFLGLLLKCHQDVVLSPRALPSRERMAAPAFWERRMFCSTNSKARSEDSELKLSLFLRCFDLQRKGVFRSTSVLFVRGFSVTPEEMSGKENELLPTARSAKLRADPLSLSFQRPPGRGSLSLSVKLCKSDSSECVSMRNPARCPHLMLFSNETDS